MVGVACFAMMTKEEEEKGIERCRKENRLRCWNEVRKSFVVELHRQVVADPCTLTSSLD